MTRVYTVNTPLGDTRHLQSYSISTLVRPRSASVLHYEHGTYPSQRLSLNICNPRYLFICCLCIATIIFITICCMLLKSVSTTSPSPTLLHHFTPTLAEKFQSFQDTFRASLYPFSSSLIKNSQCSIITHPNPSSRMKILSQDDPRIPLPYNISDDFRNLSLSMLIPSQEYTAHDVLDPWIMRLSPVYVEAAPEYALVRANILLMSGLLHIPPFYAGLPCIEIMNHSTTSRNDSTHRNCIHNILDPDNGRNWYLKISAYENRTLSSEYEVSMKSVDMDQTRTKIKALVKDWHKKVDVLLEDKLLALEKLSIPFQRSHFFDRLEPCSSYTLIVQLHNSTHITQPFKSLSFTTLSAPKLHELERQRVTAYLNHITHPDALKTPLLSLYLTPTASIASHRQPAPFETINEVCSAEFHKWVENYQTWHANRINDFKKVTTAQEFYKEVLQSKMIISIAKSDSGLTDRTNGIASLFLMSMLSQRMLVVDEGWPDVFWLFSSSLHLRRSQISYASYLPTVRKAYWTKEVGNPDTVGLDFNGPFSDDYELTHPYPVTLYTNMRGVTVEMLSRSTLYSPVLQEMNLKSETISGCIWHKFWIPRLSTIVADQIFVPAIATLLKPEVVGVGIQMRSLEDTAFTNASPGQKLKASDIQLLPVDRQLEELSRSEAMAWLRCASDISDDIRSGNLVNKYTVKAKQIVQYLMSDDPNVRIAAVARYGKDYYDEHGNMLWPPKRSFTREPYILSAISNDNIAHSSIHSASANQRLTVGRFALTEQFVFQLCHIHIISRHSGFGRLPSFGAMRGLPLFVIDQKESLTNITCTTNTPNMTQPLELAALEWSKV